MFKVVVTDPRAADLIVGPRVPPRDDVKGSAADLCRPALPPMSPSLDWFGEVSAAVANNHTSLPGFFGAGPPSWRRHVDSSFWWSVYQSRIRLLAVGKPGYPRLRKTGLTFLVMRCSRRDYREAMRAPLMKTNIVSLARCCCVLDLKTTAAFVAILRIISCEGGLPVICTAGECDVPVV